VFSRNQSKRVTLEREERDVGGGMVLWFIVITVVVVLHFDENVKTIPVSAFGVKSVVTRLSFLFSSGCRRRGVS
jgi:hypothetical protein